MGVLGSRGIFAYVSDAGNTYNITMRDIDAAAMGNIAATRGANPTLPRTLVPRHVWYKSASGLRRKITCGSPSNVNYLAANSISVDSEAWAATGRVGEKDRGGLAE